MLQNSKLLLLKLTFRDSSIFKQWMEISHLLEIIWTKIGYFPRWDTSSRSRATRRCAGRYRHWCTWTSWSHSLCHLGNSCCQCLNLVGLLVTACLECWMVRWIIKGPTMPCKEVCRLNKWPCTWTAAFVLPPPLPTGVLWSITFCFMSVLCSTRAHTHTHMHTCSYMTLIRM